jgi:purine-binding chemotaxis protein CheW
MNDKFHFVIFTLDDRRFALPLASVDQIARAVEVMPLPEAPPSVLGLINLQGKVLPVVSLRRKFRMPDRPVRVEDHLVIGRTASRSVALLVDTVTDIMESEDKRITRQDAIMDDMAQMDGVLRLDDGMVLIHDLQRVLSAEEDVSLDAALNRQPVKRGKRKEVH